MIEFFLCEAYDRGNQVIAGPFETSREAGVWRREHPPVCDASGPYLRKQIDGKPVLTFTAREFTDFLGEFAAQEQHLDRSAEAVRFP